MRKTLVSILWWIQEKITDRKTPDWIKVWALLFLALILGFAYAVKYRVLPVAFFCLVQNVNSVV